VYHIKGWGKFNRHYGDFCTGADKFLKLSNVEQTLGHLDYRLVVFSHDTIRGPRSGFRGQLSFPLNRFLREKKENPMYARKVSLCSKLESVQFLQKIEHQMVPLLRKQEGFLDQLILLSGSGETIYVYSFWDNSEDAEKYDSTTLPKLTKLLTGVIDGTLRVHAFGGPRGRLSSGSREVLC